MEQDTSTFTLNLSREKYERHQSTSSLLRVPSLQELTASKMESANSEHQSTSSQTPIIRRYSRGSRGGRRFSDVPRNNSANFVLKVHETVVKNNETTSANISKLNGRIEALELELKKRQERIDDLETRITVLEVNAREQNERMEEVNGQLTNLENHRDRTNESLEKLWTRIAKDYPGSRRQSQA